MTKSRFSIALGLLLALCLSVSAQTIVGSHEVDPKVKEEVYKVLDEYMEAFNAKDLDKWEATWHFPHYRLASGYMSILEKAGLRSGVPVFDALQKTGWSYSRWDHRNVIQASDTKVHVDVRFSRYNKAGALLKTYESLYILTCENGRWGVKMRSSYAE
ncbi:MAG: hypothetical protein LBB90_03570 [Tannerella sp.]|jgi:hypothetical protein|nr:hypothetical protein [Tannerella sp.]